VPEGLVIDTSTQVIYGDVKPDEREKVRAMVDEFEQGGAKVIRVKVEDASGEKCKVST
jgi:hypothetical protein